MDIVENPVKLDDITVKKIEEANGLIRNSRGGYARSGMSKKQISVIRYLLKQRNLENYSASARVANCRNYHKRKQYTDKWRAENKEKVKELAYNRRLSQRLLSDGSVSKEAIIGMMCGQDYRCKLCGDDIRLNFHIDHIIPLKKRGEHSIYNIQLLCPRCNCSKRDKILCQDQLKKPKT